MTTAKISRRHFSSSLTKSLAAALLLPDRSNRLTATPNSPGFASPAGPIRIDFNENPYGPSPKARAAIESSPKAANRYPDRAADELKAVLAKKHNVTPENIVLGCGSSEILKATDAAFLTPEQNLVAPEPTFEAVLQYARIGQTAGITIPLDAEHRHNLGRMAAACTSKTGIVYVCNPNNPTGTIVTREEMAEFVQKVSPATLILVDEAYFEFAGDPRYGTATELIAAHPNVVVARTFSKIYGMAGLRLGYGIGEKRTIGRIASHLVQDGANAAVLSAALASLDDMENLAITKQKITATRKWLCAELAKDNRSFIPSDANFLMIDVGTDTQPVIDQFRERSILVGRRFPSMPTYLRVTIGTQPEIEVFYSALRQIVPASAAKAA
jgi:histidinol-phosphate aminotransferase